MPSNCVNLHNPIAILDARLGELVDCREVMAAAVVYRILYRLIQAGAELPPERAAQHWDAFFTPRQYAAMARYSHPIIPWTTRSARYAGLLASRRSYKRLPS